MILVQRRLRLDLFVGAVVGIVASLLAHRWRLLAHALIVDIRVRLGQRLAITFGQRSTTDAPVEVVRRFALDAFALVLEEVKVLEHAEVGLTVVALRPAAEILLGARSVLGA